LELKAERVKDPLLQDAYLAELQRQSVPVTVYLVNGFQLRGTIKGFDPYTVVLDYELREHLVYKHAISTISPSGPVVGSLVAARRAVAPESPANN
jgi:host factor-I protein